MNALEFAHALAHLLNHGIVPIFGESPDEFAEQLQGREITHDDLNTAFAALLHMTLPVKHVKALAPSYRALLQRGELPEAAFMAIHAFLEFATSKMRPEWAIDVKAAMDDDGTRKYVLGFVRDFLRCLTGDVPPTYEEQQAAEETRFTALVADAHAKANWGLLLMTRANSLLVVAKYLDSFPAEERQAALDQAISYSHDAFHEEEGRIREEEDAEESGVSQKVLVEAVEVSLSEFCAENVYRPQPSDDGEV